MNPLSSRRYVELVDRINMNWKTIMRYLELRIKQLEKELGEE